MVDLDLSESCCPGFRFASLTKHYNFKSLGLLKYDKKQLFPSPPPPSLSLACVLGVFVQRLKQRNLGRNQKRCRSKLPPRFSSPTQENPALTRSPRLLPDGLCNIFYRLCSTYTVCQVRITQLGQPSVLSPGRFSSQPLILKGNTPYKAKLRAEFIAICEHCKNRKEYNNPDVCPSAVQTSYCLYKHRYISIYRYIQTCFKKKKLAIFVALLFCKLQHTCNPKISGLFCQQASLGRDYNSLLTHCVPVIPRLAHSML